MICLLFLNSLSLFLRLEPFVYIENDEKGTQIQTGTLIGTTTLIDNVSWWIYYKYIYITNILPIPPTKGL